LLRVTQKHKAIDNVFAYSTFQEGEQDEQQI
jgi:hypothetical protein